MKKLRLAHIPLLLALVVVQFSIALTTVQAAPLPGTKTFTIQSTSTDDEFVSTSYPWTGKPQYHCDLLKAGQSIQYDADFNSTITVSIYPKDNNGCTGTPESQNPFTVGNDNVGAASGGPGYSIQG